ncbi:branchpoint-bridging protein [Puntigrus tetrazona]|uniref:branchpoint-bridging protein n=1 Tax=Puntigrus tetrazona TaxID=1606681 RepID=UPI001C8916BE|nr:branchpoint-bridging protein [Puntigrus tetrazona]
MSSKGSRSKRTKNVRDLESGDAPSLTLSIIDEQPNIIPAGRQLERTPPSKSERVTTRPPSKPDGSPTSEQVVKDEPCGQEITKTLSNGSNEVLLHPKVKDERKSVRGSSSTAASAALGNPDPETFIQGMQGYKWTDTDLEFVYQSKWKKRVQQAQQELSELQKSLKSMQQMRDMGLAALNKIQTELSKVTSCESLQQISMEILRRSQSSSQLEGLDLKALVAKLKVADVLCTTAEEKAEVSKLKTELKKAEVSRGKEEQLIKDIDSYKENIKQIKVNVDTMKAEISALESQLSAKEEMPQSDKPRQKGHRFTQPSTAPKSPKPHSDHKRPTSPPAAKTSKAPPASKTSKAPPAPKTSKAPPASKTSKAPPAPKTSKAPPAPKTSKAPPAPKTSKAPPAPKTSKAPSVPKPPATLKAQTASKTTTTPEALEGDVSGLRRSKRIAGKKK